MTRKEIIDGLEFTVAMFLFDPSTGETITEPRNDMDKTTIDACRGAIEWLEQEPSGDAVSREDANKFLYERIERLNDDELYDIFSKIIDDMYNELPSVKPQEPKTGYISIDDVMSVFDDFMCGEVDEEGTDTFLEMLKDKAESEDKE